MNDINVVLTLIGSLAASIIYVFLIARQHAKLMFFRKKIGLAMIVASMGGMVGITMALFEGSQSPKHRTDLYRSTVREMQRELELKLKKAIAFQLKELTDSTEQRTFPVGFDSLQNRGEVLKKILNLKKEIDLNRDKIRNFEDLFLTDAENLITLPLLKRDIDGLRNDILSIKNNINSQIIITQEMQTQNRWIIGTLGLGMLALLVPVIRSSFGSINKQSDETK